MRPHRLCDLFKKRPHELCVLFLHLVVSAAAQQPNKTRYNMGVIILDNVIPSSLNDRYLEKARCSIKYSTSEIINQYMDNNLELGVKLTNIPKQSLSAKGVLDAVCKLEDTITTVVLILPHGNSYKYLPIYKYILNHISSLGIPIIVWNGYMPRVSSSRLFQLIAMLDSSVD